MPVARIAELTGLDLGPLAAADRMPLPAPAPGTLAERAVRLTPTPTSVGAELRRACPGVACDRRSGCRSTMAITLPRR